MTKALREAAKADKHLAQALQENRTGGIMIEPHNSYIIISINKDGDIYLQAVTKSQVEQTIHQGELTPPNDKAMEILRSGKLVNLLGGVGACDIIIKGTFPEFRKRVVLDGIE